MIFRTKIGKTPITNNIFWKMEYLLYRVFHNYIIGTKMQATIKKESGFISKEELQELVNNSKSLREVGRKIGKSHSFVKDWIVKYDIDDSNIRNFHEKTFLNKKKNLLTVIKIFSKKEKSGLIRKYCDCICDCGNTKTIRLDSIRKTLSCGCLTGSSFKEKLLKQDNWENFKITKTIFAEIKRSAIRRNIVFDLTIEYLWDLFLKQNKKCNLTGMDIQFSNINVFKTASLDRINSNLGYVENNVQWLHKDINAIKSNFQQDYFIKLCNMVTNNNTIYEEGN